MCGASPRIAAKADPPVCRIIDYGKYKYEQAKLSKQQKTSKNASRMKEIKFRVRTEQHDYNIKLGRIETFLDDGHKVRVVLQYRGRENAHKELGFDKLNRIIGDLKTMANVDQEPRLSGRAVGMLLSPLPKAQRQRKFHLYHGELIDEDEFAGEEEEEDEDDSIVVVTDADEADGKDDSVEVVTDADQAEVAEEKKEDRAEA